MRIVVNKHGLVYLDFGRAGSISLQLYLTYHRLLHVRVAVNSHALPVHKKNRITSLLCIFETIIRHPVTRLLSVLRVWFRCFYKHGGNICRTMVETDYP